MHSCKFVLLKHCRANPVTGQYGTTSGDCVPEQVCKWQDLCRNPVTTPLAGVDWRVNTTKLMLPCMSECKP